MSYFELVRKIFFELPEDRFFEDLNPDSALSLIGSLLIIDFNVTFLFSY